MDNRRATNPGVPRARRGATPREPRAAGRPAIWRRRALSVLALCAIGAAHSFAVPVGDVLQMTTASTDGARLVSDDATEQALRPKLTVERGPRPVGGRSEGTEPQGVPVACVQSVVFAHPQEDRWDCAAEGLTVRPGDEVVQWVRGTVPK